jgi:crotonobetainyl-CoA:carnitine CoA-transferase CaiB-like acyl-CoA transferase
VIARLGSSSRKANTFPLAANDTIDINVDSSPEAAKTQEAGMPEDGRTTAGAHPISAPPEADSADGGPLAGIRVLDLTSVVMGPLATQILGDLGADVITVESRGGDLNRVMGPGPRGGLSGMSLNLLRNKRNITLDISHPEGRSALLRIAAGCDVFVSNLRPGSLSRLRLNYPDVAAARPDIIYCQAHGFPSDSPQADAPAFDDIIQAACGVPDVMRRAAGTPGLLPTLLADKVSGLVLAYSIIAALFHRERTGHGQRVEVPMTAAMLAFLLVEHGSAAISRPPCGPAGYQRILTPLRGALRTADGWIAVQPHRAAHWTALLRAAGLDEMVGDPRLNRRAIWLDPGFGYATLGRVLAVKTTAEWLAFCSANGIPAAAAAGLDELIEALPDGDHPDAGRYKLIPSPARFSATPATVRRHAPLAGQHTREVLAEAGLADAEIAQLEAAGVVSEGPAAEGTRAPAG